MEDTAAGFEAIAEMTSFLRYINDLLDYRQPGKVECPLPEVLLFILLAVLAGAATFTDIARFGEKKLEHLRRLRSFRNGAPAHDHLGDIFATLDPKAFHRCFVTWVAARTNTPVELISLDGKTSRRSGQTKASKEAIHMVSAFAARRRIVLGQVKVNEKSNEIVAIPALLDMMSIEGAVVTIDAMGCQRNIARKIIDKKADYILALKGDQTKLREDVEIFVDAQKPLQYRDATTSTHETTDADHGRIETRKYTVLHDVEWLQERHEWPCEPGRNQRGRPPGLRGGILARARTMVSRDIALDVPSTLHRDDFTPCSHFAKRQDCQSSKTPSNFRSHRSTWEGYRSKGEKNEKHRCPGFRRRFCARRFIRFCSATRSPCGADATPIP